MTTTPTPDQAVFDRLRAHRAHLALVPLAIANIAARLNDADGEPLADNEPPRDGILCGEVRVLLKEIERLAAEVKRQNKDAAEAQRDFQREAREIAAEARWQDRNDADGLPHGTY